MRDMRLAGVVFLVLSCLSARLGAQTLSGTVADRENDSRLTGVSLQLFDSNGRSVALVFTDSNGVYTIPLATPGEYSIVARGWGYERTELGPLEMAGDNSVNLWLDAIPQNAEGHELHGVILDDSTRQPIGDASIVLLDNGGKILVGTISDAGGLYELPSPGAGLYALRVDGTEYRTLVTPSFVVGDGQNVTINVRLSKEVATQLDPITVTADAPVMEPLPIREFHRRRERGVGQFLTREELEVRQPFRFSDALRMVPGVRVVPMPKNPERPLGPGTGKYTVRIRGLSNRIGPQGCPPVLYLDGIRMGSIDDAEDGGPDMLMFPHDIEGIEVYSPATVPAEYGGSDAGCGVIVVWKKRY